MKTHRFDALSFVTGLAATGFGILFLIPAEPETLIDFLGDIGSWFWPVVFLTLGTAILAPLFLRKTQDDEEV